MLMPMEMAKMMGSITSFGLQTMEDKQARDPVKEILTGMAPSTNKIATT
jgi:hypothetical protein